MINEAVNLVKPTLAMKDSYLDFASEWKKSNEEIIPSPARLLDRSYEKWLTEIYKLERKETCPEDLVPAYTYFLVKDERILGAINIRHELNDYLFNCGGHIGYGVRPSERGKGYATYMLKKALSILKDIGVSKVLLTCDKKNVASAKTILKCDGRLENEVNEGEKVVQRYWFSL
jgi:predicted acetyltransferase